MSPEKSIENVDSLVNELGRMFADLKMEADDISLQWEGLCAVGGGRADHAAQLLSCLIPHLERISKRASSANDHIKALAADPFQRNASAA